MAFSSSATNLVVGDINDADDIFVFDRQAVTIERVSVDSAGNQAEFGSDSPSISSDGRFVAFRSWARNLVAGDTNNVDDIFVFDRQAGTIERISVDSGGNEADDHSLNPAIGADGRFVAFASDAANLVVGDTNGDRDIFVRSRLAGHEMTLTDGQSADDLNFGNFQPAEIRGTAWQDIDIDGQRDTFEPGLAGWTVFLDDNHDVQFDTGERYALTDAGGAYAFLDVPPGSYDVAQVVEPGWRQLYPLVIPPWAYVAEQV